MDLKITFNNTEYTPIYNSDTGYYELKLTAPETGGVYPAEISFTDLLGNTYTDEKDIQIITRQVEKFETNDLFMWIFSWRDFSVKDIVQLSSPEIIEDEETNGNSTVMVLKETTACSDDIVAIKRNGNVVFWGIIENIQNASGEAKYVYTLKYITNMFDQKIELKYEEYIKTLGVEDFIARAIQDNFMYNTDLFVNKSYLRTIIKTHTIKQTTVSNVENGIYNLHTWMTNCTQLYNITYEFSIVDGKLVLTIENKEQSKLLVDTNAMNIADYEEVFETNITAKVVVLTATDTYTLFLKTDRTTTTNKDDPDRAYGKVETIYTEDYADAPQSALDVIRSNTYNHNITFKLNKFIPIGTPIAIKTKKSLIYDTYISSIKITDKNFYEYECGNIRINFIEKLLKERGK